MHSGKKPNIRPLPLLHSIMKAAEQRCGYLSFMYVPSVIATRVPPSIASLIHSSLPTSRRDFHIHVHPHSLRNSFILVGIISSRGGSVFDTTAMTASSTSRIVHTCPHCSSSCPILVLVHLLTTLTIRGRLEGL